MPPEMPVSSRLADFARTAAESGLPAEVRADAIRRFADFLGNCLAARGEPAADVLARYLDWEHTGPARALGTGACLTAADAAFWNGSLAHALDFDDTHMETMLHPTAVTAAAALGAAQASGADGERFLAALAVGNEVAIRVGLAATPSGGGSGFFARGLHPTSVGGTFGATVAAALLSGLDRKQTAHALGIATSLASGIIEANRAGGMVKQIHCGQAARNGVVAAELAACGLTGPPTAFEGEFGFIAAFIGDLGEPDRLTRQLGTIWHCAGAAYKPYPTNVFLHSVIEAASALRARGLTVEAVGEVRIGLPGPVLRSVAEPPDVKAAPPTGYAAKFSAPFVFAIALRSGSVVHGDFDDSTVADPLLRAVAERVTCYAEPTCAERYPLHFGAVVSATARGGATLQAEVLTSKGTNERPMTDADHQAKLRGNLERFDAGTAPQTARRLWEAALDVGGKGPSAVVATVGLRGAGAPAGDEE